MINKEFAPPFFNSLRGFLDRSGQLQRFPLTERLAMSEDPKSPARNPSRTSPLKSERTIVTKYQNINLDKMSKENKIAK